MARAHRSASPGSECLGSSEMHVDSVHPRERCRSTGTECWETGGEGVTQSTELKIELCNLTHCSERTAGQRSHSSGTESLRGGSAHCHRLHSRTSACFSKMEAGGLFASSLLQFCSCHGSMLALTGLALDLNLRHNMHVIKQGVFASALCVCCILLRSVQNFHASSMLQSRFCCAL